MRDTYIYNIILEIIVTNDVEKRLSKLSIEVKEKRKKEKVMKGGKKYS